MLHVACASQRIPHGTAARATATMASAAEGTTTTTTTPSSSIIQLYSLATPNGQKVAVALEELGLRYEAHTIDILKGDQFSESFKAINPNSKVPAIVDPDGPGGKPLALFESGAILCYLSDKAGGRLLPQDPAKKWQALAWLHWQMGGLGPMSGQFGHFSKYAPEKIPYAIERYTKEVTRLLGVLEGQLAASGGDWIVGADYTIADIAIFPWVAALRTFYHAEESLGLDSYPAVNAWLQRCLARPASKAGMAVTPMS